MEISEKKIMRLFKRAEAAAENSPDDETKVGAILVSKKTCSAISDGYNGFVRGAVDEKLPKTRPDKYEYVIHAEANLLANAARDGISTDECIVVQTISPCVHCMRLLYQAGIDTVYYKDWYYGTDKVKELGDLVLEFTEFEKYTKIKIKPNKE